MIGNQLLSQLQFFNYFIAEYLVLNKPLVYFTTFERFRIFILCFLTLSVFFYYFYYYLIGLSFSDSHAADKKYIVFFFTVGRQWQQYLFLRQIPTFFEILQLLKKKMETTGWFLLSQFCLDTSSTIISDWDDKSFVIFIVFIAR